MINQWDDLDAFDLADALYHWLQHNWVGMDDKYEAFCQLTEHYTPSRSLELFENIEESAKEVYLMLNDDNYESALERVLNYNSED